MATIRLIPSTYAVSSTSYLSVSNASNMYANTDSTTYATITNTNASTSSRYLYLRGFNFSSIPSDAVINSFTVKIKGYESGLATSTSYAPRLANGTSALSNTTASSNFGTSSQTITIPTGALTWQQIVNYGSNFTIMVYVRRSSRNTTGYFYCYGAEILVDYTIPVYHTVTATVNQDATVSPASESVLEGESYTLTITPTDNTTAPASVTDNGTDVTSSVVRESAGSGDTVNAMAASYETSGISSGTSYISYAIGHSAENPNSSSGNYYADSDGYVDFSFDLSSIPSNATIKSVACKVYGHAENSTQNSERYSIVQLYAGSTAKGSSYQFSSTSNTLISIPDCGTWTRAELDTLVLRHSVGYYGGGISGITLTVEWEVAGNGYVYTYTIASVTADHSIVVTYGSSTTGITVKVKSSGSWIDGTLKVRYAGEWKDPSEVWKKQNGTWVKIR